MTGLPPISIALIVGFSLLFCVLATSLAMESAALFVPAFVLLFPALVPEFPVLSGNAAIGLVLVIMFFGQISTLVGYWYREQIDLGVARSILVVTVPLAVVGRVGGYYVPDSALLAFFAVILIGLAIVVTVGHLTHRPHPTDAERRRGAGTKPAVDSFDTIDRIAFVVGGLVGGLVGFSVGELTNTTLHTRKGLSIKVSTGTSTLVLFLTLLVANVTNLVVVFAGPPALAGGVTIPWSLAVVVVPAVIVGGQVGAWLNSHLRSGYVVRMLVGSYVLVGAVTIVRLGIR